MPVLERWHGLVQVVRYNVLLPRSDCVSSEDLFAHYTQVRGNMAFTASEVTDVEVPVGSQPCNLFGVIKQLSHVVQYNGGNATFIANRWLRPLPI